MNKKYDKIKELVKKYPNDMKLGEKVRHYVLTNITEEAQYKLQKLYQKSE
tara:strand:- start:1319 stop:1468 length:150 start_codon:yes stop_codon:yes gene_type:complete